MVIVRVRWLKWEETNRFKTKSINTVDSTHTFIKMAANNLTGIKLITVITQIISIVKPKKCTFYSVY
jgi:hypothetical protein